MTTSGTRLHGFPLFSTVIRFMQGQGQWKQSLKRLIADGINAVIEHKTDSICVPLPKSTHVYAHIHGGRTVWRNDEACAAMRIAMEAEDDMLRHVAISLDENDLDELRHDLR